MEQTHETEEAGAGAKAEAKPERPHGSMTGEHTSAPSGSDDVSSDDGASDHGGEANLVECKVDGCHEVIDLAGMMYHLDLHAALDCQEDGHEDGHVDEPAEADGDASEPEAESEAEGRAERKVRGNSQKPPHSSSSYKSFKSPKSSHAENRASVRVSSRRRNTGGSSHEANANRSVDVTADGNADERRRRHSQHAKHGHKSRPRAHTVDGIASHVDNDEHPRDRHRERRDRERTHVHSRDHRRIHSHEHDREHELETMTGTGSPGPMARRFSRSSRPSWWPFRSVLEHRRDMSIGKSRRPVSVSSKVKDSSGGTAVSTAAVPAKPKQRLGKAELGRYAHEERMPDWLAVYLKKEWGVCHNGVIPVLKQLLEQSPTTEYAYLCDPCVTHVSRLQKEGGFCGYRNIQTMVSYVVGAKFPGYNLFGDDLPNIFDIQNIIENAWDMGINASGRVETGGIRWTRKYIGTPEAMAMFRSLNIPCNVQAFNHRKTGRAAELMLREVERYFETGKYRMGRKVRATSLPPIYWQHPGHSLTIVGIEKTTAGQTNLLVFDPIFKDGSPIVRLIGRQRFEARYPDKLLQLYRRGPRYLGRFKAFELLKLDPRAEDVVQLDGDETPGPSSQ
ncbi:duf1671 domain containing protein [Grosmannia clavigera kw1407]|uniref:Duf1671 domain containing protein n=1 Tax=Grosmannia clavigera (strain kw1407 / UAMH 11150) TaxID=655863 RepID=F0XM28_GROCL|nr:duf1671 domain containing protein [Grosmannia clavigera kw1407]EFX01200.1 duf1671 domain containing protein [Grosmannia clavigera kw1407]